MLILWNGLVTIKEPLVPGFHALIPFVDKVVYKQDLREETIEVEPQECFTAKTT